MPYGGHPQTGVERAEALSTPITFFLRCNICLAKVIIPYRKSLLFLAGAPTLFGTY